MKRPRKVNICPSWRGVLGLLLALLECPSEKARASARFELQNMAHAADCWNTYCDEKKARKVARRRAKAS